MANNKDEAGKGMPRPGELPAAKRPYATLDLKATEVEGREPAGAGAPKATPSAPAASEIRGQGGGQAVRARSQDRRLRRGCRRCRRTARLAVDAGLSRHAPTRDAACSPTWQPARSARSSSSSAATLLTPDTTAGARSPR